MSFDRLPTRVTADLSLVLEHRKVGRAITLVFANSAYSAILDNWLRHAIGFCNQSLVVFALDAQLHDALSVRGVPVVRLDYDGTNEALWLIRLKIFEWLCEARVDFIHSDADAVWLRDPATYCYAADADLVMSQGTVWPPDVAQDWGFVLCCGFFAVRASCRMQQFFSRVTESAIVERDDQVALNKVLKGDGMCWSLQGMVVDQEMTNGIVFQCFDQVVYGRTTEPVLQVAMLPQDLFQRIPRLATHPYVKHLLAPKEAAAKIALFKAEGCWLDF